MHFFPYIFGCFLFVSCIAQGAWEDYGSCQGSFCTTEFLAGGGLAEIMAEKAYEQGITGRYIDLNGQEKRVTVAVVDDGLRTTHSEFVGQIDPRIWDKPIFTDHMDDHGTHVSGIIAAKKNDTGMHGVAFDAQVLTLSTQFSNSNYGQDDIENWLYLAEDKNDDIRIINNSWGYNKYLDDHRDQAGIDWFYENYSDYIQTLPLLTQKDKLLVMAAGNENQFSPSVTSALPYYDKTISFNLINVIAADPDFTPQSYNFLTYYSNLARGAEKYSITAPGGSELGRLIYAPFAQSDSAYESIQGTSMAAPHVSGVAALVQSAFPYMGGRHIADVLLSTATPINSQNASSYMIQTPFEYDDSGNLSKIKILFISLVDHVGDSPRTLSDEEQVTAARDIISRTHMADEELENFHTMADFNSLFNSHNFYLDYQTMTYEQTFGQGFLNAAAAVKGPGFLDANRLWTTDFENGIFHQKSEFQTLSFNQHSLSQFMYTVNTAGYTSEWSNDIGEKTHETEYTDAHVGLFKTGLGTLRLSGQNTFQGVSVIEGGTLALTGSMTGGIQVRKGIFQLEGGLLKNDLELTTSLAGALLKGGQIEGDVRQKDGTMNISNGETRAKHLAVENGLLYLASDGTLNLNSASLTNDSQLTTMVKTKDQYGQIKTTQFQWGNTKLQILLQDPTSLVLGDTLTVIDGALATRMNEVGKVNNNLYQFNTTIGSDGLLATLIGNRTPSAFLKTSGNPTQTIIQAADAWTGGFTKSNTQKSYADALFQLAQTGSAADYQKAIEDIVPDQVGWIRQTAVDNTLTAYYLLMDIPQKGLWIQPFYSQSRASGLYKTQNRGFIAGGAGETASGLIIGAGYGYWDSDVKPSLFNRTADLETHFIFGQIKYVTEPLTYNAIMSYSYASAQENRPKSQDNYTVNQGAIHASIDYHLTSLLNPYGGVQALYQYEEGYRDNYNQRISGTRYGLVTGLAGLKLAHTLKTSAGILTPSLRSGATYDLFRTKGNAIVQVENGKNYRLTKEHQKRLGLEAGIEVSLIPTQSWALSLSYNGRYKKHFQNHTGMLKAQYEF